MSAFKEQGNNAFKAKEYEKAIELYTQAVEETPTDHTILGNRAAAYQNLGKFSDAEKDADRCIALKADWSKGY